MSPNGDRCRITAAKSRRPCVSRIVSSLLALAKGSRVPDRAAVRDAVLLACRGHDTLIVERRGAFRAVIIDKRADRDDLRVLVRMSGGASVLGPR
jgi:hypothetical protein